MGTYREALSLSSSTKYVVVAFNTGVFHPAHIRQFSSGELKLRSCCAATRMKAQLSDTEGQVK